MRRGLILLALFLVIALAHNAGPVAVAAQYCSTTCAVSTLECNASTTCSSGPGTLTCCGTVYTCGAIDAYDACRSACQQDFELCVNDCVDKACLAGCQQQRLACNTSCGSRPQTSFSC